MKLSSKQDDFCREAAVYIHRDWQTPEKVAAHWMCVKRYIFDKNLDIDVIYKRIGDYLRQCFDREPRVRDVPLEEATVSLENFVRRMNMEM